MPGAPAGSAAAPGLVTIRAYQDRGELVELHFEGVPKVLPTPTGCIPYGVLDSHLWRLTTCDPSSGEFLNAVYSNDRCTRPVWNSTGGPEPLARGSYPISSGEFFQPDPRYAGVGGWTAYGSEAIIWKIVCGPPEPAAGASSAGASSADAAAAGAEPAGPPPGACLGVRCAPLALGAGCVLLAAAALLGARRLRRARRGYERQAGPAAVEPADRPLAPEVEFVRKLVV